MDTLDFFEKGVTRDRSQPTDSLQDIAHCPDGLSSLLEQQRGQILVPQITLTDRYED